MKPDRVLEKIEDKESISVLEAERGVLASFLRAEDQQAKRHPSFLEEQFGQSISQQQFEKIITAEFQNIVQNVKGSHDDVSASILRKAVTKLNERLDIEEWDDDIANQHKKTCTMVINRST